MSEGGEEGVTIPGATWGVKEDSESTVITGQEEGGDAGDGTAKTGHG